MKIVHRLDRLETVLNQKQNGNVRPWWEFESWQRELRIIDLIGKAGGKDLLTNEGVRIAHQVQMSFARNTKEESVELSEEYFNDLTTLANEFAVSDYLRPYVSSFDTLRVDMLACISELRRIPQGGNV